MTTPRLLSERYELGDTLGYGGMSEVHRGRDVRLGREVAVKVLRADLARDPQFQLRFRREAQNAAALNHPAIVAVYDTGETESEFGALPYIVMEYVDGQTLREIVKSEGPLTQQRVIEVMADVCAALDFSHRHGIIHRDVKPANVMITTGGAVKVMDFGIARALADGQNMTQTAAVIGTAQYLSPEQARGEAVDARSDVYAAGCVLFELLTGEPPFSGDSPVAVAYQHVREDVRQPSEVNADVGPELDAIVLKAMSKNPANRYQSAAEMRSDLVRVLRGQRPLAPQVMSEEERTSLMTGAGPTASLTSATRRLTSSTNRHAAAPSWATEDAPKRSTAKVVAVGIGVAALLAVVVFVATRLFGGPLSPEQIEVPDVANQQQEVARQALNAAGFKPTIRQESSGSVLPNQATRTDPPAGSKLAKDKPITLYVSIGPPQATVPDLTGLSQSEASQRLETVGLKLAAGTPKTTGTTDPSQVDKVVTQDPKARTTVPGQSTVSITLGIKQNTVPMPDVTGQREDDAYSRLEQLGFRVSVSQTDGPGDRNTVIRTNPAAGQQVAPNSSVTIYISRGNQAQMPNLRGYTQDDARKELKRSGFDGDLRFSQQDTDDPSQSGTVIGQSVRPGDGLDPDGSVTLNIGRYRGSTSPSGRSNSGPSSSTPSTPNFPGSGLIGN
ncbi:Stk1 family PASTA domain-containing Ser/Thr kinase [Pseudonocardia acaciae]|uniref:Stk1 family PASTA domain-containing Ser/Thr kinase n=1 Tax=Pseudonocardia acaciae TaxID=551276 RepID=UPI00048E2DCF|nr:Stk1 family PASTA domain-containing Ser/Thr kinase [Pseudonocardia acaciae]